MTDTGREAFLRLFRSRYLLPRPRPPLTAEHQREREQVQAELLHDLDAMRVRHGLEPLERTRWQKLRRWLRQALPLL